MNKPASSKELLTDAIRAAIEEHDSCRITVQDALANIWGHAENEIKSLENSLFEFVEETYQKEDDERQAVIQTVKEKFYGENTNEAEQREAVRIAKKELTHREKDCVIVKENKEGKLRNRIRIDTIPRNDPEYNGWALKGFTEAVMEKLILALEEKVNNHYKSKLAEVKRVEDLIRSLTEDLESGKKIINNNFEEEFKKEDDRLQRLLMEVTEEEDENVISEKSEELKFRQIYRVLGKRETMWDNPERMCTLFVQTEIINFEEYKMEIISVDKADGGRVHVTMGQLVNSKSLKAFTKKKILTSKNFIVKFHLINVCDKEKYKAESEDPSNNNDDNETDDNFIYTFMNEDGTCTLDTKIMQSEVTYAIRSQVEYFDKKCKWSDWKEFKLGKFKDLFVWKTANVSSTENMYFVDNFNPKIVRNLTDTETTIIGSTALPPESDINMNIIIRNAEMDDDNPIYLGVAPFDIDQNARSNYENCGWYLDCYHFSLVSGPPHNYMSPGLSCGRTNKLGHYIKPGDKVSLLIDTGYGCICFMVDDKVVKNRFNGVPLDKPLVPCVIIGCKDDVIEVSRISCYKSSRDYETEDREISYDKEEKSGCIIV